MNVILVMEDVLRCVLIKLDHIIVSVTMDIHWTMIIMDAQVLADTFILFHDDISINFRT